MNIWKIVYLNCGERYEDIDDHCSYIHNLSSCEISAWKKFRPEWDLNQWPLPTGLIAQLVELCTGITEVIGHISSYFSLQFEYMIFDIFTCIAEYIFDGPLMVRVNWTTVESRFLKPPGKTQIDSRNRRVWEIGGKITVFDWGEGMTFGSRDSKKWGFERSGFHCL